MQEGNHKSLKVIFTIGLFWSLWSFGHSLQSHRKTQIFFFSIWWIMSTPESVWRKKKAEFHSVKALADVNAVVADISLSSNLTKKTFEIKLSLKYQQPQQLDTFKESSHCWYRKHEHFRLLLRLYYKASVCFCCNVCFAISPRCAFFR